MQRTFWWAAIVGLGCFVGSTALLAQERSDEGRRERGDRGERSERGERPERGGFPGGPGGERGGFPGGPGGERGGFDRGEGGERGGFDRGERGGFDRGDRGEGGERRFDPTDILRRIDRNGDGQIEPDEVSERSRRFVVDAATRAGLDPTKPISVEKLIAGSAAPGSTPTPTPTPTAAASTAAVPNVLTASLIPGFGVPSALVAPPGFDVPLAKGNRFERPLEERFDKAVIDRVNELLKQMDKNKDNMIEYGGDEGKENRWQGDPKQSDLNHDGKLDREELCKRLAKLMGSREKTAEESTTSRGGGSGGSSGSSEDQRAKFRRYAEGLLKQNDANANGQLEKEEWAKMRGDNAKADVNSDGVITLDELTDRLANYSSDSGNSGGDSEGPRRGFGGDRGGESGRGGSTRDRGSRDTAGGTDKRALRLLTAIERLPKGLPTWFTRNDLDADAQISMSEYSTSWNDTTAAEFAKYDLNSDGMITPNECLAGEKLVKK